MCVFSRKKNWLLIVAIALSLNISLFLMPAQATPRWWSCIFRSQPPDQGSPGGGLPASGFCAIAPAARSPASAFDRPTLVWQGNVASVELWQFGATRALWRADITAANRLQQVQLEPGRSAHRITAEIELQPDQQYEWHIRPPRQAPMIFPFQAVSAAQHQQIQQNLPAGETAAIDRADYFASQQLWMDFWQEVLSIEQPSVELNRAVSNTFSRLCPQIDVQGSFALSGSQTHQDFPLIGVAGQSIEISIESNDFEPTLMLFNSQGEVMHEIAGQGRQIRLEARFPEAGNYIVRAALPNPQAAGSYSLKVTSIW